MGAAVQAKLHDARACPAPLCFAACVLTSRPDTFAAAQRCNEAGAKDGPTK